MELGAAQPAKKIAVRAARIITSGISSDSMHLTKELRCGLDGGVFMMC
jgi:hypothetical protein